MLGLLLAVCFMFMLKGWRKPAPEKEIQKASALGIAGSTVGFMVGMFLGATIPQIFFSDAFLKHEGAELGAIVLLSIGFSVVGAICSLIIYGFLKMRKT